MDQQQMVIGLIMLAVAVVVLVALTRGNGEPADFLWAATIGEFGSMFVVRSFVEPGLPQFGVTIFFMVVVVATLATQMRLRRLSRTQRP